MKAAQIGANSGASASILIQRKEKWSTRIPKNSKDNPSAVIMNDCTWGILSSRKNNLQG